MRLLLLDMVPFVGFLALIEATWLYDRENFLPAGLIYALLFFVYGKLQRIEMSLSADIRETLLLKTDNRVAYGFGKVVAAAVVCGTIYVNWERGWVDVRGGMEKLGLLRMATSTATPGTPAKEAVGNGKEAPRVVEEARPGGRELTNIPLEAEDPREEVPAPAMEGVVAGASEDAQEERKTGKEDGGWEPPAEKKPTEETAVEGEEGVGSETPTRPDEGKAPSPPGKATERKPEAPVISGFQTEAD